MSQARSTLDGLPKEFVKSLRVLFDILDDSQKGYIGLTDIANHWDTEVVSGLPPGILEALKKVTPPSGQLSFERFVAGLKIALLRMKNEKPSNPSTVSPSLQPDLIPNQFAADSQILPPNYKRNSVATMNTAQRAKSMPKLGWEAEKAPDTKAPEPYQYPWRQSAANQYPQSRPQVEEPLTWRNNTERQQYLDRRPGDGRSSIATTAALKQYDQDASAKPKRREPRRHTLANGVDYNMIKRMKQLETERDILLQGYEAVEAAREWYRGNLANLEQRMKYVSQPTAHGEHSVEANQERINFQTARILEVNQQLRALLDSSKKGFPFHMHLAVSQSTMERNDTEKDNTIAMLKAQNKMLTKEVSAKSDNISKLENEKAQLLRDMFQGGRRKNHEVYEDYDDTTFI